MANGIVGGLENILGLNTDAGTAQIQQAIQALQAVGVPNAAQLTLPELQKYVSAGILTPQQYQAISENPDIYTQTINQQEDQTGLNAQKAALQQLGGIVSAGGSTPINQANLINNINTANQAMQAARQGIQENAQERGVAGGGQEFLNQLLNEQGNASNANANAVNSAANNAQLALQALSQQGSLGTNVQGQQNQQAQAEAQAANQIAQYNSQLQSAANQYNTQNANAAQAANLANAQNLGNMNTQNANYRTQYNAQVPQTIYQDQMSKAGALAGQYGNAANLAEQQAAQQNAFTGNLIGAGANVYGDYLTGQGGTRQPLYNGNNYGQASQIAGSNGPQSPLSLYGNNQQQNPYGMAMGGEVGCYAQGGEIHDHSLCMKAGGPVPGQASVPGDSQKNDTVPAMLSPHEIVLPRTVSQAPNAPQQAAKFVGAIKGQQPPLSFADIIKKLEENGLELRLGVR